MVNLVRLASVLRQKSIFLIFLKFDLKTLFWNLKAWFWSNHQLLRFNSWFYEKLKLNFLEKKVYFWDMTGFEFLNIMFKFLDFSKLSMKISIFNRNEALCLKMGSILTKINSDKIRYLQYLTHMPEYHQNLLLQRTFCKLPLIAVVQKI